MQKRSLNGDWTLRVSGWDHDVRATVPGSVYHDLLAAGEMPDPFWRDNEDAALKLMEHDFVYTRTFEAPESLVACKRALLRCEGLDTLAEISVNGVAVGSADNMHRIWEFDLKGVLRAGENTIAVTLRSPTRFIREAYAQGRADGSSDAMVGFPLLRKAHCMFGWDWGPRLPDAGIWREIALLGIEEARMEQVHIRQRHEQGRVVLSIETGIDGESSGTSVDVTVTAPDGGTLAAEGARCEIEIDEPMLWWPNGLGDQPLYRVCVTLSKGGVELDCQEKRIGLRTLTMTRRKDEWGESFCHTVNGVDVFAMGADYIPEDNLLPRVTPERTRRLLEDAKLANFNCVRVWAADTIPTIGSTTPATNWACSSGRISCSPAPFTT